MFKAFKAQVILIPEIKGNVIAVSKETKKAVEVDGCLTQSTLRTLCGK